MTSVTTKEPVATPDKAAPKKVRAGRRPSNIGTYLILGVLFLIVLFPVYYGLVGSLMGERDTNSFPPALYPENGVHPENYSNALDIIPLGNQYLTSVLQTLGITLGQMVTSALAAYAFVFLNLRWRGFWFAVFLSTMMIPSVAGSAWKSSRQWMKLRPRTGSPPMPMQVDWPSPLRVVW